MSTDGGQTFGPMLRLAANGTISNMDQETTSETTTTTTATEEEKVEEAEQTIGRSASLPKHSVFLLRLHSSTS